MIKPRLRPGVGAAIDEEGRLRVIFFNDSRHVVFDVAPPVTDVVRLLDSGINRAELSARVRNRHPEFTDGDLDEILSALDDEGAIEETAHLEPSADLGRFGRQVELFYDLTDGQVHPYESLELLRDATVAIIGVGGTGTWVAQSLALAGVGTLRLVDPDHVEEDNLSRQVLYSFADIGAPKVEAAKTRLREQCGRHLAVEAIQTRVGPETTLSELVRDCDLVVNCADEPDINTSASWIHRACHPRGVPYIVGGAYTGHVGLIGPTIVPGSTACWGCFLVDHEYRTERLEMEPLIPHRKRHTGAFAPLAAVVANLQVCDAIRVLGRLGEPSLANRLGELDLRTLEITWREVRRTPQCADCREEAA